MKQHRRGSSEPQWSDPDFLEALDANESGAASSRRKTEWKTRQLCRQVQRTLNAALADRAIAGLDLFVDGVTPAPDCGRLLVHVVVPAGQPLADTMIALSRATPRLRADVASSITRKRAPELCFVPACPEGGVDE